MKPTFSIILLLTATIALGEYPRLKYRNPSPFPKPPPFQQISKKWQQHPPRPPIRSRPGPIPVHMPKHHNIPMGMAASINRPVALPVRNLYWKNAQTTYRTPINNNIINTNNKNFNNVNTKPINKFVTSAPVLPNKAFQSSPAILAQEYDFHIQSNNIPTPIKTIKQIGEKGPIHTIPAPNLSLADKPLVIEEVKKHYNEVRNQPEVPTYNQDIQRQPEVATYVQIQKSHQYQVTEIPENAKPQIYQQDSQTYEQNSQSFQQNSQNFQQNYQFSPQTQEELYQILSAYSQQPSTLTSPVLQEPQDYILVPQQSQNYVHEHVASDKSFDEANKKDLSSSLVTAAYNLEPEVSESVVHSQYVQNYFDTRNANKNVEPDAKPSKNNNNNNNNEDAEGFYVSLPNKEAAERLANLQAAGKLNNKLKELGKNGNLPVSIYVPEDGESREQTNQSDEGAEPEYDDDYDDLTPEEINQQGGEFGHKLQPKN